MNGEKTMETKYNKCYINDHGTVSGPVIIGDNVSHDDIDYTKLSKLLGDVLVDSDDKTERICALEARQYADQQDKNKLKQFINTNLNTFTNGTFTT